VLEAIWESLKTAESSIKAGPKQLLFYIKGARGASSKGVIVPDGFAVFKDSQIA